MSIPNGGLFLGQRVKRHAYRISGFHLRQDEHSDPVGDGILGIPTRGLGWELATFRDFYRGERCLLGEPSDGVHQDPRHRQMALTGGSGLRLLV